MPQMAHVFRVQFHQAPQPHEPFRWKISDPIDVEAMTAEVAQRLARTGLGVDATWTLRRCDDLGAWNQQEAV